MVLLLSARNLPFSSARGTRAAGDPVRSWLLAPRPRRAVIVVSAVGRVIYALSVLGRHGGHFGSFWDGFVGTGSTLLGLLGVARRRGAVGFGVALAACAFVFLNLMTTIPGESFDGRGPLDANLGAQILFFSPYLAFFAHLVLIARSRLGRTPRSVWLDAVISGGAAASLVGATWLAPLLDEWARFWFGGLIYTTDLFLLGVVLGVLAATGWARDRQLLLVLGGGAAFAVSDIWATSLCVDNTWHLAAYPIVPLMVASLAIQSSCWIEPQTGRRAPSDSPRVLLLPIGGALVATCTLGAAALVAGAPAPAAVLALVALALSPLRWALDAHAARESHVHQRLSRIDELTGIANRRGFYWQIDSWCRPGAARGLAALIIDLDGFKDINDRYGHHVGDAVLVVTADRLSRVAPAGAAVGRLGGDEFAICVHMADERAARDLARRIAEALSAPLTTAEHPELPVGASVGGVWSPMPADRETLLRAADRSMYRVKGNEDGELVTTLAPAHR